MKRPTSKRRKERPVLALPEGKRAAPVIAEPLVEERCARGQLATILVPMERCVKIVRDLAAPMNVRRARGTASLGALLDAISLGKIALRRRDDPEQREFYVGMRPHKPSPARPPKEHPRCPGEWHLVDTNGD